MHCQHVDSLLCILSPENRFQEPSLKASESTIVRMSHFSALLTIVFLLEAGNRRLSMTSLYGAFRGVRIALLNPEDCRHSS